MYRRGKVQNAMYRKLFHLKFEEGLSTLQLMRKFPNAIQFVIETALLQLPKRTLRAVVLEDKTYTRLMRLRKIVATLKQCKHSTSPTI